MLTHGRKTVTDSEDADQLKSAQDGEKDRDRDLAFIMSQPRGRRWMYELVFDVCHVSRLSHYPGDTHTTAFNEGARSVGERLQEELRSRHFDAFITMLEENRDDRTS